MNTMTPKQFCAHFDACSDGEEFAANFKTMADVWDACPRADWLLWILDKLGIKDEKKLRLFGCWCMRNTRLADGRTVWDLLTNERSRKAFEIAEAVAKGEATQKELDAAGYAGDAAWAARDAAWAARVAASGRAPYSADKQQSDHLRTVFSNPFKREAT